MYELSTCHRPTRLPISQFLQTKARNPTNRPSRLLEGFKIVRQNISVYPCLSVVGSYGHSDSQKLFFYSRISNPLISPFTLTNIEPLIISISSLSIFSTESIPIKTTFHALDEPCRRMLITFPSRLTSKLVSIFPSKF